MEHTIKFDQEEIVAILLEHVNHWSDFAAHSAELELSYEDGTFSMTFEGEDCGIQKIATLNGVEIYGSLVSNCREPAESYRERRRAEAEAKAEAEAEPKAAE